MPESRVPMRRQAILDDLRRHPLSTAREIANRILEETGGAPALLTGALYISADQVYADLVALHRRGEVWRFKDPAHKAIAWQVSDV